MIYHLFESARTEDYSKLQFLCDPYGENDSDSNSLCFIEIVAEDHKKWFVDNFKNGRIMGVPLIQNDIATVEIAYGTNSNKLEKIKLIKRLDKWYFYSF